MLLTCMKESPAVIYQNSTAEKARGQKRQGKITRLISWGCEIYSWLYFSFCKKERRGSKRKLERNIYFCFSFFPFSFFLLWGNLVKRSSFEGKEHIKESWPSRIIASRTHQKFKRLFNGLTSSKSKPFNINVHLFYGPWSNYTSIGIGPIVRLM